MCVCVSVVWCVEFVVCVGVCSVCVCFSGIWCVEFVVYVGVRSVWWNCVCGMCGCLDCV